MELELELETKLIIPITSQQWFEHHSGLDKVQDVSTNLSSNGIFSFSRSRNFSTGTELDKVQDVSSKLAATSASSLLRSTLASAPTAA